MRIEYFQLIDRIVDINLADRTIRCEATVPTESTVFEGHFPGYPIMPGVLLTEAMAQTAGWLIVAMNRFERMPFLVALKDVKLRTFVTPGQKLALSGKLVHEGSGFAVTEAEGKIDGKTVCEANITFRIVEFPNAEMHEFMRNFAKTVEFPMKALADG